MTFNAFLKRLKDGMGGKPPTWAGYVYRRDEAGINAYDPTSTAGYAVGTVVTYMSSAYECQSAIQSGRPAGAFDKSKWKRYADIPHVITFVERSDPKLENVFQAVVTGEKVTYLDPYHMMMSGELLSAFASDEWSIADEDDLETARAGTGRW